MPTVQAESSGPCGSIMNDATLARAERDQRILRLRAAGLRQTAIADEVGCSQATVSRVLDPGQVERRRAYERTDEARKRRREAYLQWAAANAEQIRERRAANAVAKREAVRQWRQQNPERTKAANQAHYRANRERLLARFQGYRQENAERLREGARARYAANPEVVRAYRLANREVKRATDSRRRARRRGISGRPLDAIDRLLSVEYRKAIAGEPCTYCGEPSENDDHKLPLARGGTDHWWNLHRTCQSCNFRKHTMTHEEFLASGKVSLAAAS